MKARPGREAICTLASGQDHTTDHEPIAERTGLPHAGCGDAARPMGAEGSRCAGLHRAAKKTLPVGSGRERSSTGATACSSEPCDLEVSRSARRLAHLVARGGSTRARRLPGSARPTDGGNRPAGGNARDFFAAELPTCVRLGAVRDEQDGRSDDDRQLGRTSLGEIARALGALLVLAITFVVLFCW